MFRAVSAQRVFFNLCFDRSGRLPSWCLDAEMGCCPTRVPVHWYLDQWRVQVYRRVVIESSFVGLLLCVLAGCVDCDAVSTRHFSLCHLYPGSFDIRHSLT